MEIVRRGSDRVFKGPFCGCCFPPGTEAFRIAITSETKYQEDGPKEERFEHKDCQECLISLNLQND